MNIWVRAGEVLATAGWRHLMVALLHTLWQGAVVAAGLWVVLRWVPARRAGVRYGVALGALMGVVLAGVVTWAVLDHPSNLGNSSKIQKVAGLAGSSAGSSDPHPAPRVLSHEYMGEGSEKLVGASAAPRGGWVVWVGGVWLCGLGCMLVRLGVSLGMVARLRGSSEILREGQAWELLEELRRRLGIGRVVRLAVNARIGVPVVIGVVWPMVLVPPAALSGVSAEQLRLILLHELAHVRRWDYLVNLVQMLVEAVLFFNPLVWWISRQVRMEREGCCDAVAVAAADTRLSYAEVLVEWAAKLTGEEPMAAPALARGDGTLMQRLRRIVLPDSQPAVRMPWHSTVVVLVLSVVLLSTLRSGAQVAVAAAEKWLTPEQRLEKLVEIERTHGENRLEEKTGNMTVSGVVRTVDGAAPPAQTQVLIMSKRWSSGFSARTYLKADASFVYEGDWGVTWIAVIADGYRVAVLGPLTPDAERRVKDLEVVLERGFAGRVRLVGVGGEPVRAVTIKAVTIVEGWWVDVGSATSDADGLATFANCPAIPLRLETVVEGYQFEVVQRTLQAEVVSAWKLTPAKPVTGRVVTLDGAPIAGALIEQGGRCGYEDTSGRPTARPGTNPWLGTTDAEGGFTLASLRTGAEYELWVSAPGYGRECLRPVVAGQTDLVIKLGGPRRIRGTIVGDVGVLASPGNPQRRPLQISYAVLVNHRGTSGSYWETTPVLEGGAPSFEIGDLPPCRVEFKVGAKMEILDLTTRRAVDDVVIDLRPPAERAEPVVQQTRTVIVQMKVPAGEPMPRGKLRVDYVPVEHPQSYTPFWLPLDEEGRVQIDVPVPTRFRYKTGELVGHWVEERSGIEVLPGSEPLVLEAEAFPAGAIFGRVLNEDGTPCREYNVTTVVASRPTTEGARRLETQIKSGGPDGRYSIMPLVLGGSYRAWVTVHAKDGRAMQLSEVVTVDAQHPAREVNLQLQPGVTVRGKLVDPHGKPVVGMQVALNFSFKTEEGTHGGSGLGQWSDEQGRFSFARVNPELDGTYRLEVQPGEFQGKIEALKPADKELTITLQAGVGVKGTVIDDATGRPIANATLRAVPEDFTRAANSFFIHAQGNARGEFEFRGMAKQGYTVYVNDAYVPGTRIVTSAAGKRSIQTPAGLATQVVQGGQTEAVVIRVVVDPASGLRVVGE